MQHVGLGTNKEKLHSINFSILMIYRVVFPGAQHMTCNRKQSNICDTKFVTPFEFLGKMNLVFKLYVSKFPSSK